MTYSAATAQDLIDAIRGTAESLGRVPARSEFLAHTALSEYQIYKHFDSWNAAVRSAGLPPHSGNERIADEDLLADWASVVRSLRNIPTLVTYRRMGSFSPEVLQRRFGAWSKLPDAFREYAGEEVRWADVLALLPSPRSAPVERSVSPSTAGGVPSVELSPTRAPKLVGRPTYGDPIDFRGLRHEPVNEQGVVFLFGMVARELGYLVEAVQTGFPDCEAKRQVGPSSWQRVRIEFEFQSRNFRDHGHPPEGCDVIVCWQHNWEECPANIEVLELCSTIQMLSSDES